MTYFLNDPGNDPLAVMAALRSAYRLSLGEARSLIANAPAELPATPDGEAEAAVERLRAAGASVSTSSATGGNATPPQPENPYIAPEPPQAQQDIINSAADESEDEYYVYLPTEVDNKLVLLKSLKEAIGWGLKETKEWIDATPPQPMLFPASCAFEIRDLLARDGFTITLRPKDAASPAPSKISKITITNPGPKRMHLIPLFKKELKMRYSEAATLAERGGEITSFPDPAAAARVAEALRDLGAEFTL